MTRSVNCIRLKGVHIVADHRVHKSVYSSREVTLAVGTAMLWRGPLKGIQSILLLPQHAVINLAAALSTARERFTTARMLSSASSSSVFSILPLFSNLCLFLFPSSLPWHLFPPSISSFSPPPHTHTHTPVSPRVKHPLHHIVTWGHTLTQQWTRFN